jgi:hypothetical protein
LKTSVDAKERENQTPSFFPFDKSTNKWYQLVISRVQSAHLFISLQPDHHAEERR